MASEEAEVPQTQTTEDTGEDHERGQSPEVADEPKAAHAEEEERPKEDPEPEPKPPKEEPPKEEEKKEEPPKKVEPPKREEPRKEEPRRQETKKEDCKPAPVRQEARRDHFRRSDPRGKGTEKEDAGAKGHRPGRGAGDRPDGRGGRGAEGSLHGGGGGGDSKKTVAGSRSDAKSVQDKSETSEGRTRQKVEFFKEELKRLQENLKRESSKITPPSRKKYKPFIFNTLEPYYNTHTTKFLVEMPDEAELLSGYTFSSRSTAQGLIDPWINLRMDQEILPQISSRPTTRSDLKSIGKPKNRKGGEASRKEGSTRLPKFPVVALETKDLATKQLYYSDVPNLRKELKNKYSAQARNRVEEDYKRTQQDFYRMDLDRLDQVPPGNRQHMTSTYMAYLQNTPGSRRALNDCVRTLHGSKAH